jgi:hypothetical protein
MKHRPVIRLRSIIPGVSLGAVMWGGVGFLVWLLLT